MIWDCKIFLRMIDCDLKIFFTVKNVLFGFKCLYTHPYIFPTFLSAVPLLLGLLQIFFSVPIALWSISLGTPIGPRTLLADYPD